MIVSHARKFIFIKPRKTAGSSIEIALSRYCEPGDIVTRINEQDEERLRAELGGLPPSPYYKPIARYNLRNWGALLLLARRARAYDHMTAERTRELVGSTIWNSYYKFTATRNPWDAMISYYWWRKEAFGWGDESSTIEDFIRSKDGRRLARNSLAFSIGDEVVVDRICRFESLEADLALVASELGLEDGLSLPHTKGGTRRDRRNYREYLSDDAAQYIASMFRKEVEVLGYEY